MTDDGAPRWAYRLGMLQATLLWLFTGWLLFLGLPLGGLVVLVVIPASLAALASLSTSAWRRGESWAWWIWASLSVLFGLKAMRGLVGTGSSLVDWYLLISCATMLALLAHPDNRPRMHGRVEPLLVNSAIDEPRYHTEPVDPGHDRVSMREPVLVGAGRVLHDRGSTGERRRART
jgi:hypothetical protein